MRASRDVINELLGEHVQSSSVGRLDGIEQLLRRHDARAAGPARGGSAGDGEGQAIMAKHMLPACGRRRCGGRERAEG
eukprot:361033-Chlamydomonas_euryale.AAC.4